MKVSVMMVAMVCHEANRAYCVSIGDYSQPDWWQAPVWQQESAINGVEFHIANPDAGPEASHENWRREKKADGWGYGPIKNEAIKAHPCMVPFNELPIEQQRKDVLFRAIVHALRDPL